MTPHPSTLAWKIPWTEEPGRLQSMGSRRVGHDWVTSLSLFTFMHWRKKWQPTPAFLPGESQGRGSLVGCRLWGSTESDTTEVIQQQQQQQTKAERCSADYGKPFCWGMGFLGGSVVKNPSVCAGDLGSNLGREDPLEKEMATHSSVLAWRIPGTGEPGGLPSMGSHRVGHD